MPSRKTRFRFQSALERLLKQPTTSFHENAVIRVVENALGVIGIPFRRDRCGNLIAHLHRGRRAAPLALVAHMDHPGFLLLPQGSKSTGHVRIARVLGGVGSGLVGKCVRFFSGARESVGIIVALAKNDARGRPERVRIKFRVAPPLRGFGLFDVPAFRRAGTKIYARAIDDVCGVGAMLEVLNRLKASDAPVDLYACFTRAEEVGFVGAAGLARERLLPKNVPVISIEMSRMLPGRAVQGRGFVVRVGDRSGIFDPAFTQFLIETARSLKARRPRFLFQIAVLDGGVCEASLFNAMGYHASGVALPLGNYHNRTPAGGVGPEYIDTRDLAGLVEFLVEAARRRGAGARPSPPHRSRFERMFQRWRKFM